MIFFVQSLLFLFYYVFGFSHSLVVLIDVDQNLIFVVLPLALILYQEHYDQGQAEASEKGSIFLEKVEAEES